MSSQPGASNYGITSRRATFAAVLLVGTTLGGWWVGNATAAEGAGVPVNAPGVTATTPTLPNFTRLVARVEPAVVSITNALNPNSLYQGSPQDKLGQLPFPFNQMIPQLPQLQAVKARGSGFIINPNGTIVTNNHVIKDAKTITVKLDDGTTLTAKVIGRDPRTDIAVLKVDADHPLPYIQLGNSTNVKPGEWVIALGNPFGLGETVTAGIVSAVSRNIGDGPYDQFIQTDAPINPGNSGGPLLTQNGKVIGIDTAILSPSGGSVGIGFAIPSNVIRSVADQLIASGHVTRGYMGVEAQELTNSIAHALHVPDKAGVLLAGVMPSGPGKRAGLKVGDIIQSVDGQKVANPRDLALDIAAIKPGDYAHLVVLHDGHSNDVTLKVVRMPNEQVAENGSQASGSDQALGVALSALSPAMRDELDVPGGTQGAVITNVQPGSLADEAGLRAGDVIVGMDTHEVTSPAEAAHDIRSALHNPNHALALRVLRDGQPMFVGIQIRGNVG
jgi:serine protease Do